MDRWIETLDLFIVINPRNCRVIRLPRSIYLGRVYGDRFVFNLFDTDLEISLKDETAYRFLTREEILDYERRLRRRYGGIRI